MEVGTKKQNFLEILKLAGKFRLIRLTYRNKLTYLKEISKQNYYTHAYQKCNREIRKTWKLLLQLTASP